MALLFFDSQLSNPWFPPFYFFYFILNRLKLNLTLYHFHSELILQVCVTSQANFAKLSTNTLESLRRDHTITLQLPEFPPLTKQQWNEMNSVWPLRPQLLGFVLVCFWD